MVTCKITKYVIQSCFLKRNVLFVHDVLKANPNLVEFHF
jgi:hypothetical protein